MKKSIEIRNEIVEIKNKMKQLLDAGKTDDAYAYVEQINNLQKDYETALALETKLPDFNATTKNSEYTEEDEILIDFIEEAKNYCINAIGYIPDSDNPLYIRFVLLYVANAYDNRELGTNNYEKTTYSLAPILKQLKYCYERE